MVALKSSIDSVRIAAHAVSRVKATDMVAFDVTVPVAITDIMMIAVGSNERQVLAIAEEIEKDLYDLCIAFRASYPEDVLARRHAEGKVTTLYTCCAEAYPNMFIVSPPYEAAWLAWRALATDCDGYLRWAYNSWTTDPLKDGRFRQWPAGDCFMVYPEGRSSIRMEMLTEGIQDYEKVRILASEWTASGDIEKLEALGKVLEKFTFEELTSEGAEKAVSEARAFIAENM